MTTRRIAWILALAFVLGGCAKPDKIVHGLQEREANHILVLLEDAGIASTKVKGEAEEGIVWDIEVPAADASAARQILVANGLPRTPDHGYGEAAASTGMIPSASDEKMKAINALQGEINRQLKDLPEVIEARVVLSVPERDTLAIDDAPSPSASVVLVLRRGEPTETDAGLDDQLIKRIVANAVPGLDEPSVAVIQRFFSIGMPTAAELAERRKRLKESGKGGGGSQIPLFGALGLVAILALLLMYAGKQKKDLKRRVIHLQRLLKEGEAA